MAREIESKTTWFSSALADAVAHGLHARAEEDDIEQVIYGFDHLDELGLHPLVHKTLRDAGYGVWPEQRYPSDWNKLSKSKGLRCDVVLTQDPNVLGLRDPQIRGTLFDQLHACDAKDAYWLEIKTVSQYTTDGPFARYTSELLASVTQDLKKLWKDSLIRHSGLLLVLYTTSKAVADHDLAAWHHRCLDRGYPVGFPVIRGFNITDRIGNSYCAVGVFSVREW